MILNIDIKRQEAARCKIKRISAYLKKIKRI